MGDADKADGARGGPVLVVGATGRQGGAVARTLLAAGRPVRIITRRPDHAKAQALAEAGADVIRADLDEPQSLRTALDGVAAVYGMQTPYEGGVAQEEAQGLRLAALAHEAGVKQFVYGSVAAADEGTGVAHYDSKGRIEAAVKAAGFPAWTILRPTLFMEMFLAPFFRRAVQAGEIALAMPPDLPLPMVPVVDIARAAGAAFADPDTWNGRCIDLSSDSPTMTQVAAALETALERPLAYRQIDPRDLPPDVTPKARTQTWFTEVGFKPQPPADLPFTPLTFEAWAHLHKHDYEADHDVRAA